MNKDNVSIIQLDNTGNKILNISSIGLWGLLLTFNSEYEPFFQPPSWIIGPVWMVLYTTLAISFYICVSKKNSIENFAIISILFLIQLILNFAWADVFDSANYLVSTLMIVIMIIFTIIYAWMIYIPAPVASKLVWPYILWITFAALINAAYYLEAN